MHLYLHKGRHVVVSRTEVGTETGAEVRVARVGLAPGVEGAKKRGRHPNYEKPVLVAELTPVQSTELSEETLRHAEALVAALPEGGE